MAARSHPVFVVVAALAMPFSCSEQQRSEHRATIELSESLSVTDSWSQSEAFKQFEQNVPHERRAVVLVATWDAAGRTKHETATKIGVMSYVLRVDRGLDPWTDELEQRVTEALYADEEELRVAAFDTLNRIGDPQLKERLATLLFDPSADVRNHVLIAIGFWENPRPYFESFLKQAGDDPELSDMRDAVLQALIKQEGQVRPNNP